MKSKIILVLLLISLTSCSVYKSVNMSNVKLGMTKSEVEKVIGKKPDNVIGSKSYKDGIIEVIQYSRYDVFSDTLEERYFLYFFNDKLIQWGRPGDWEKESDRVYEVRYGSTGGLK